MTIIDEILICANRLANEGKKPSVALIKAKLNKSVPLPTIITTLKTWQHQPDFIAIESEDEKPIELAESPSQVNDDMKKLIQQTLNQELAEMKKELSDMKALIKELTKQLKQQG